MEKKVALVTLIESSTVLSDEGKLSFIDRVPSLTDRQVNALGKYFAAERQFVLDHKDELQKNFDSLIDELEKPEKEKVYVGSGKPV